MTEARRRLARELAPPDPTELFRIDVVTGVDFSTRDPVTGVLSPPTLTVGEGEFARPMRFQGKLSDYNIGQTVMYIPRPGGPIVQGPVPVTGEDPLDADYEGDIWHEIGAAGEPTFTNSWVNYGAPYDTAAFIKQNDGWVRLKGLVKNGTSASAAMFTLPAGYLPPFDIYATTMANGIAARLRITSAGVVSMSAGGATPYASLNGVTFPTAWNRAAWLIPRMVAPWDYDLTSNDGLVPELFVRDDGWCWLKGILNSETSAPSTMAEMPQEAFLRRNAILLAGFAFVSSLPSVARVDNRQNGLLIHNNTAVASSITLGNMTWFGNISSPVISWIPVSFASGWSAYASTINWLSPSYTKDHFGVVHLSGLGTSTNANPTTAFTLPVGYRPAADQVFTVVAGDNLGGRVDVLANGDVRRILGATGFCSFDGISFRAAS